MIVVHDVTRRLHVGRQYSGCTVRLRFTGHDCYRLVVCLSYLFFIFYYQFYRFYYLYIYLFNLLLSLFI